MFPVHFLLLLIWKDFRETVLSSCRLAERGFRAGLQIYAVSDRTEQWGVGCANQGGEEDVFWKDHHRRAESESVISVEGMDLSALVPKLCLFWCNLREFFMFKSQSLCQ